jgi:hypothetical protein
MKTSLAPDTELTPDRFEYIAADKVQVTLKTKTGDAVSYTMSTGMLLRSITMSVDLINSRKVDVLTDLNLF